MPKRVTYHVTPSKDGRWQVKAEHAKRASAKCDTKAEAVSRGKEIVKSKRSAEIVVHKKDGRVQTKHTYVEGNPSPPGSAARDGKRASRQHEVRGMSGSVSYGKGGKEATPHKRRMTARDLLQSGLVGIWKDRKDIGDSQSFARKLRERAQRRSVK